MIVVAHDSLVCLPVQFSDTAIHCGISVALEGKKKKKKKGAMLTTETENDRKCMGGLFFRIGCHCRKVDFISDAAPEFLCGAELVQ